MSQKYAFVAKKGDIYYELFQSLVFVADKFLIHIFCHEPTNCYLIIWIFLFSGLVELNKMTPQ